MAAERVRIVDIAEELGLSTATVSNVIHGKTKKRSAETIRRVQMKLEETGYIPNMAGILLARNNSRIIGVIINDNAKYEGKVLEDGFVMASLNALSHEMNETGYFMMVKTTASPEEIPVFASMWNMNGLILMGFCETDYEDLRSKMHIPFVVYDGYFESQSKIVNLVIDHYNGGVQAGAYLKSLGHENALCLADNYTCMDKERIEGFTDAFAPGRVTFWQIPMAKTERLAFYESQYVLLKQNHFSAVFAVSDYYALDFARFVQTKGMHIPADIQIVGFDDSAASRDSIPSLTTIHQDAPLRAKRALSCIEQMRNGTCTESKIVLPVTLLERESTGKINNNT